MASDPHSIGDILDALDELADKQDRVSLGDVIEAFGNRSYGPFLLLPALVDISPVGSIPGLPTVLACVILLTAVQMVLGRKHLWLPGFLRNRSVKADGLAAGKGVTVAETLPEAEAAVRAILDGSEGGALVIEECLFGEEASFFALCDGTRAVPIGTAQDHKRVHDGDRGPNTGGMGAYSPASIVTPAIAEAVMTRIIAPTLEGMAAKGTPFSGILYAGLMLTSEGPKLIEYNTRFGDPEAQVLMPRLTGDLVPALLAAAKGDLSGVDIGFDPHRAALTVVMAAQGYPGTVRRGTEIRGAEAAGDAGIVVFQAGTRRDGERLLADGGRVLAVTALGASVREAKDRAYAAVRRIDWPDGFFRTDIGSREVAREQAASGD